MIPRPKLVAVITALTCFAWARGGDAAYTLDQLADIERLIVAKDCGGLRSYIEQYPALLEGDDPLADELRSFVSGIDTGLIACLSYRPEATAPNAPPLEGSGASGAAALGIGVIVY